MKYPVDPEIGMPYGVAPAPPPSKKSNIEPTDHHPFWPNRSDVFQDLLGRGVRAGRVHSLASWLHNSVHKLYSEGLEEYPVTDEAKFGLMVYEAAGYLPRRALVHQKGGSFILEHVDDMIYSHMRSRLNMHPQTSNDPEVSRGWPYHYSTTRQAYGIMSKAAISYVACQDIRHLVGLRFVEDFVYAKDDTKRRRLGKMILNEAVQTAVLPLKPQFKRLHREGLMRLEYSDPFDVVKRTLLRGDLDDLNKSLTDYLTLQIEKPVKA